tara:strand:+ start:2976 stop:4256 length:1281 start_codon:yes stop_codon:yes gene_type:complete
MFFKLKILLFLIGIKLERLIGLHSALWYKKLKIFIYLKRINHSKFYASFDAIRSKFLDLPIMNKSLFMKNFDSINTCGISYKQAFELAEKAEQLRNFSPMIGEVAVGFSTGTSGNRGMFLVNDTERAKWVAYMIDRVVGFSLKKKTIAFFLRANNELYESSKSKRLSFNFFDIYINIDSHVDRLNTLSPDILIAQPSVLMILAKKKKAKELRIQPTKIVSVAEVLTQEDRKFIESIFEIKLSEVYQCTEGFLASSCSYGTMHFNEDFLIVEKRYLDEEKTKFHPIITDLIRKTQPVVRYELNDIITEKSNCKCGSKFLGIENVEGRSDDIIILEDINQNKVRIFPDIIRRAIVLSCQSIEDYTLIQKNNKSLNLYIKSELEQSYSEAVSALEKVFVNYNIIDFEINIIENYRFKIGNKKRRVINES